ncbi:flagellar hook-basal body protein FliE [Marinitoga sp. 1135]|uniref:Flagellar hook-basal body complex protein FliE n=1 Tax=Marinitoga piezophila (strain DSM 14283 / JCM 11233 / KA3) TaxID=443254 RepID=H2J4Q1_MARPK|nr:MULTISPECIES: flagellar hook-basal body complex protein FliE [Marinitoga]AEX85993.1 flagellar hook-basal body complex protein FliE [Marinitoga piezophila KA3]APT76415.1 flagellar hook-basal body protein FliE [Marinitoga sp. 1137]NUU96184.1 flagellar hook-basal body protein FliE [Marinitoga sp. 1135]NUU98092.1 flagellar hook-basal body protein FliE [Marinitoga sp. 1138]
MIEKVPGISGINGINNIARTQKKDQTKQGNLNFADILKNAIEDVNKTQKVAQQMSADYAAGKIDNIHNVIISAEKASLSLKLTTEVTNKIVQAYKEIMRMQI